MARPLGPVATDASDAPLPATRIEVGVATPSSDVPGSRQVPRVAKAQPTVGAPPQLLTRLHEAPPTKVAILTAHATGVTTAPARDPWGHLTPFSS